MTPRVFIIHGWNGSPGDAWIPWLRQELTNQGMLVETPAMPNPRWPLIPSWTKHLEETVGVCDEQTYFIGHSLGCQAILRYFERMEGESRAGGALFVGGFIRAGRSLWQGCQARLAIGSWLRSPPRWEIVRERARSYVALFSDDDAWVAIDNAHAFRDMLRARTHILHGYGHFTGNEGIFKLPEALEAMIHMTQLKEAVLRDAGEDGVSWKAGDSLHVPGLLGQMNLT